VERLVHLAEVRIGDVRVALSGGDTRVAQERLDGSKIRPILE
jgi:hypothetical protein